MKEEIVTDFENCYCKATQDNYDRLVSDGYSKDEYDTFKELTANGFDAYLNISKGSILSASPRWKPTTAKQIKLNSNNEWVYVEEDRQGEKETAKVLSEIAPGVITIRDDIHTKYEILQKKYFKLVDNYCDVVDKYTELKVKP
jgi:hypothetical protein